MLMEAPEVFVVMGSLGRGTATLGTRLHHLSKHFWFDTASAKATLEPWHLLP